MPAQDERDDYDVFLDTWEPGPALRHASLPSNLEDPVITERLREDFTGKTDVVRTAYAPGIKVIGDPEKALRGFEFFQKSQGKWSEDFREALVESHNIDGAKVDSFIQSFATAWVDGKSRRQDSVEMKRIKASIRDHDRALYRQNAGRYVLKPVAEAVPALFSVEEMAAIFKANSSFLEVFIQDYLEFLDEEGPSSINSLYVRRGVHMPNINEVRTELYELSSYSLTLGPVEQFAQTWTEATRETGVPSIFSAPLPAIQDRVVAFSAFIKGMDLNQLEFVVAPPVAATELTNHSEHGGIHEFEFR